MTHTNNNTRNNSVNVIGSILLAAIVLTVIVLFTCFSNGQYIANPIIGG